jgi:hypothetical protein
MINEKIKVIDTVQVRHVLEDGTLDMSPEGLILETNNKPSFIQRIKMWFGLYKCAGDAMMNWGLQQLAISVYNTYGYVSVGTSSSTPSDYTLNDVVTPVLTRISATKSYDTTFIENDTVQFIAIFTPSGTYLIVETGLHDAETGGHMGARQTTCNITTTIDVPFGILWRVCIARG